MEINAADTRGPRLGEEGGAGPIVPITAEAAELSQLMGRKSYSLHRVFSVKGTRSGDTGKPTMRTELALLRSILFALSMYL